jgi:hypothetical protein
LKRSRASRRQPSARRTTPRLLNSTATEASMILVALTIGEDLEENEAFPSATVLLSSNATD